jgi:HPt (histidine-containing phosphotransfer) domain-containing protein
MVQAVIERLAPSILGSSGTATASTAPQEPPARTESTNLSSQKTAPPPSTQDGPASVAGEAPVDLGRLDEFSGGNAESFQELVSLYLTQTSEQIQQLQSALNSADYVRVARVAHSCAGASSTCGMVGIAPLLRKLETAANGGEHRGLADLLSRVEEEFRRIQIFLKSRTARP